MSTRQKHLMKTTIVNINLTIAIQDDSLAQSLLANLNRFFFVVVSILGLLGRFCFGVVALIGDFCKAVVLSLADLKTALPKPNLGIAGKLLSILFNSLAYAAGVIK